MQMHMYIYIYIYMYIHTHVKFSHVFNQLDTTLGFRQSHCESILEIHADTAVPCSGLHSGRMYRCFSSILIRFFCGATLNDSIKGKVQLLH